MLYGDDVTLNALINNSAPVAPAYFYRKKLHLDGLELITEPPWVSPGEKVAGLVLSCVFLSLR
jgi:hypothetical protein